ncbi:hypothetical protein [Deinococcus cellulosilyticus]|uniref:Uncharacterized protein n=1 Tax=Deinococcus cellulosilyticus (strain DSM 18568 / NBRC 106333 / KACC 11606 / 5516J-15) TaxID=1223518 RepID=A0A511N9C5_DEIC1|nr:hypothetical protein [Deinococcus cellulosilyticus]GEM49442.1 hypothetical protein DC3_50770 [Deinococcus cellulosilyticus NBRC 106333 = KACC 11606]
MFIPAFKDAGTFLVRLTNYNQEQFTYTFKLEGTRKTLAELPCFVNLLDTPPPPPPPPAYVPPRGSQYFELGYFITQAHLTPNYRVFLDDLGSGEYRLLYKGEPVNFTLGASYVVLKDRMVGLKSAPAMVYGSVWLPLEVLSLLGCESDQLVDTGLQATCQGNTLSGIARQF